MHSKLCSGDTGVRCPRPKWGKEDLHASSYQLRGWLWSRPPDSRSFHSSGSGLRPHRAHAHSTATLLLCGALTKDAEHLLVNSTLRESHINQEAGQPRSHPSCGSVVTLLRNTTSPGPGTKTLCPCANTFLLPSGLNWEKHKYSKQKHF